MTVLYRVFILIVFIFPGITQVRGQQFFNERTGQYIDEPVAPVPFNPGPARVVNYDPKNVFYSGLINLGMSDSVFETFTGDPVFSESTSATSFFINFAWKQIRPLRIQEKKVDSFPAYSYGFEVARFNEDRKSALSAKSGSVTAPPISMGVYFWSFNAQLFIVTDPFADQINPYFGAGWGFLNGDISSENNGKSYKTSFQGLHTYNSYGVQIEISETIGLAVEFRQSNSTPAKTSNDPFGQGTNDSSGLKFASTAVNMIFYWIL